MSLSLIRENYQPLVANIAEIDHLSDTKTIRKTDLCTASSPFRRRSLSQLGIYLFCRLAFYTLPVPWGNMFFPSSRQIPEVPVNIYQASRDQDRGKKAADLIDRARKRRPEQSTVE